MTNEAYKFALFNAQVKIFDDDRRPGGSLVGFGQIKQFEEIAHMLQLISIVSCFSSLRRTARRRAPILRGMDKSSGSIAGSTNFFVTTCCCPRREAMRNSQSSRRNVLNSGW